MSSMYTKIITNAFGILHFGFSVGCKTSQINLSRQSQQRKKIKNKKAHIDPVFLSLYTYRSIVYTAINGVNRLAFLAVSLIAYCELCLICHVGEY